MKLLYTFMITILFQSMALSDVRLEYPIRGQGSYKWLTFTIYQATLWGPKTMEHYSSPLGLELKYKMNFKGFEIAHQSEKELLNAKIDALIASKIKTQLLSIFPDVKKGDSIFASYNPNMGIIFYDHAKMELGRITDITLSQIFLDIWLGEKTSDPDLRNKLLGRVL